MSKACFGVEQLFTKDSARNKKNKPEDNAEPAKLEDLFPLGEDAESTELDENEQISETHSDTSDEQKVAFLICDGFIQSVSGARREDVSQQDCSSHEAGDQVFPHYP